MDNKNNQKNIDNNVSNLYPAFMLDEKNPKNHSKVQNFRFENGTYEQEVDNTKTSQDANSNQNNLNNLLGSIQSLDNPLTAILPMLLQNNLNVGNFDFLKTNGNTPPIFGQNGANLINLLSTLSNNKTTNKNDENKIKKYTIIKDLD